MSIGANVLAPWVDDRARMMDFLVRLQPQMVVVCDEPAVAAQVKSALSGAVVIHRWVVDGDGSHTNWTPQEWVRNFAMNLPPGVMGYCLNEPGGDWRALSGWLVAVMSLCGALNIPLCVGNFSKGKPPRPALDNGDLDELLLAFNDWPLHRLGYHPYWTDDPDVDEHADWHLVIQGRASRVGAKVQLFATESGRDEHGGYDDGYHQHMASAAFAEKETRHAANLSADGVPVAPYCYGKGGPETVLVNGQPVERFKWEQFDWQNDAVVQSAFLAFNAREREAMTVPVVVLPNPASPRVPATLVRLPDGYTYRYVRTKPLISSNELGRISLNEPVLIVPGDMRDGWMFVESRRQPGVNGWMYRDGTQFALEQPTPTPTEPVSLTREEYDTILSVLVNAAKRQGGT